jgi:F1F0 ATPase subunit 2
MMNEPLHMILVLVAGLLLGTFFFGGLWLTVKKAGTSKSPSLLVFGSFISRIAIVLIGFYFIGTGNWRSMLIAFAGFMIARFMVIRFTKSKQSNLLNREA